MRIFLLVTLAVVLTATAALADTPVGEGTVQHSGSSSWEEQIGTVGEVSTPPDGVTVVDRPAPTPPPAPKWQTRAGTEEAAKRVLRGDFAPKKHSHRPSRPAPTRTVYRDRVVERQVPPPAQRPVVVNNFVAPPAQPAPTPATAGERRKNMFGWVILGLVVVLGGAIAFYAIGTSNARQIAEQNTRQAQATQLATALANQAPFTPAPGRKVSISANIFPNGGGIIRADADDKPVVVPNNSWVITPGPVAPAPPAPQGQGQAIDLNAQAAAGANA